MSDWSPNPELYSIIVQFLLQSQQSPQSESVKQQLTQLLQMRDLNSYLAVIFAQGPEDDNTRTLAGLVLKNNIITYAASIAPDVKDFIKRTCLPCIGHPVKLFRTTFGMIASSLIITPETGSWPELIAHLPSFFDSPNPDIVDGAIATLLLVLEDATNPITRQRYVQICDAIIHDIDVAFAEKMIQFTAMSQNRSVQQRALACLKQLVASGGKTVLAQRIPLLEHIFQVVSSADAPTLLSICQFLNEYIERDFDVISRMEHFGAIIDLMLHCSMAEHQAIALEACEFWIAIMADDSSDHCKAVMTQILPRLVPVLLNRMVYSDEELKELSDTLQENDTAVPDNRSEIAPHFAKSRAHTAHDRNTPGEDFADSAHGEEDWDEDEEDEDEDASSSNNGTWTLRKCSAAALDIIANMIPEATLDVILPLVLEYLQQPDWKHRECGILSLGAIADGCIRFMGPHLPSIIPYLVNSLPDPNILVKCISCWTLGKYSPWIAGYADTDPNMFASVLTGLLSGIQSTNKRIQQSSCSALASFEDHAKHLLIPYISQILTTLMPAFQQYQSRNLHIMYDAIGTLAESVGDSLSDPEFVQLIMPPLYQKLTSLSNEDLGLVPLLECLSCIAPAVGMEFAPFAPSVFERCLTILQCSLPIIEADYGCDDFFRNLIIVSLDMISGIADGMEENLDSIVAPHANLLVEIVLRCTRLVEPDVRQSAFALVGDLTLHVFDHVRFAEHQFVQSIATCLNPTFPSSCNNAVWALGELAMQMGPAMNHHIDSVLSPLIHILTTISTPKSLPENVAICIGRIGSVCPEQVAPRLGEFAIHWCKYMRDIRDNSEKDAAFRGILALVSLNEPAMLAVFIFFCDAVASWQEASIQPDLKMQLQQTLLTMKQRYNHWEQLYASIPPLLSQKLSQYWGF